MRKESAGPLPPVELQQIWFAMLRRAWSSLVVIPAHDGNSAVSIARGLAAAGSNHRGRPVTVITPAEADLAAIERLVQNAGAERAGAPPDRSGESARLVVALEPIVSNPLGIGVALAADAALLCVTLGETPIASAKRTVEMIGQEHFIGCVIVRPSSPPSLR
jgi:hypothetical protein